MSRPWLSVPIGWAQEKDPSGLVNGGKDLIKAASGGMKSGVTPVARFMIDGPTTEATVITATTIIPNTASLFLSKRRQASCHKEVPLTTSPVSAARRSASPTAASSGTWIASGSGSTSGVGIVPGNGVTAGLGGCPS